MIGGRAVSLTLLLVVALGLAAVVYAELTQGGESVATGEAAEDAAGNAPTGGTKASIVGFALPRLADFARVTERPLFSATRRPPPPQASQEAIKQSGTLALEGVILSKAERLALISHGQPPALSRVPEGQEVEGWTVVEIRPDGIVLQRDATRQELRLRDKPPRRQKPPAPKP
jgi:general secretion pathway protein N